MNLDFVWAILVALFLSYALTPVVKHLAIKIGAVDTPQERKVHVKVMPRLGGLAIYLAFTITVLIFYPLTKEIVGLIIGGTIITLLGVLDDKIGVSPKVKLLGQLIAAIVVISFGIKVNVLTNPFGISAQLGLLSIPVTIIWIVGVTNALNLIDGLDGLAAGVSAISAVTLGIVAYLGGNAVFALASFILAASCLGFLKHNFYPAKIFMGDTGSMFLGFNLASLAILGLTKSVTFVSLFIPILVIGIPILDIFFAIVRRFYNKKSIFEADKGHLHHRLMALGLSHKYCVLTMYGVTLFFGISAIGLYMATGAQAMVLTLTLTLFLLFCAEQIGILDTKVKDRNPINPSIVQRKKEL